MSAQQIPAEFPRLETKRLVLRDLVIGDSEALFQNYSDEEIAKNFLDAPLTDVGQARRFIEAFKSEFKEGKAITWVISLKGTDALIGTCSYMLESNTCAEIGYDLSKTHWGKGLMNEALQAMIAYGFDVMGFRVIKADTLSSNTRSIKLLKRLEFQLDDVRENSHYFSLQKQG